MQTGVQFRGTLINFRERQFAGRRTDAVCDLAHTRPNGDELTLWRSSCSRP